MIITITRGEGPSDECGIPKTAATFTEANAILHRMSMSAPKNGCCDKCDFSIKDDSLDVDYSGRYDLKHWIIERPDLQGHVLGYLSFYGGESCPDRMTAEQYQDFLTRNTTEEERTEALRLHEQMKAFS